MAHAAIIVFGTLCTALEGDSASVVRRERDMGTDKHAEGSVHTAEHEEIIVDHMGRQSQLAHITEEAGETIAR